MPPSPLDPTLSRLPPLAAPEPTDMLPSPGGAAHSFAASLGCVRAPGLYGYHVLWRARSELVSLSCAGLCLEAALSTVLEAGTLTA